MKHDELDPVLTLPTRLAVVATLADGARWSFTSLRDASGLADGNLHVQTRRLEEAGYVSRSTTRNGKRSVTSFSLTREGRRALEHHVEKLRRALGDDDEPDGGTSRVRRGELGRGADPSRVW